MLRRAESAHRLLSNAFQGTGPQLSLSTCHFPGVRKVTELDGASWWEDPGPVLRAGRTAGSVHDGLSGRDAQRVEKAQWLPHGADYPGM